MTAARSLVVGGAGFLGSHLVDRLLAEGNVVDVVDDLSSGSLANLADACASAEDGMLKIHHLDASGPELAELVALRRPEVVFALAVLAPGDHQSARLVRSIAVAVSVLEAARADCVDKVVVTLPAVNLYGDVPTRDLPVKEGHVAAPVNVTGVLAHAVVELLALARREDSVEFTALALASVYGSRQRPGSSVVAAFREALADGVAPVLHGDGRQTRDFLFVDDAVDAVVRAGQRGSGLVVNVGTGKQTAIRDLWELMAGSAGSPPVLAARRAGDVSRFAVSPTRARIHLGWAPWTPLAEGLRSLG